MPELPCNRGRNWSSIPEVNTWLYLLTEIRIHPQFWKSIPDFISKVKELNSGIEDQFLPLLEGNSGIVNRCQKWIPHFRSVKWWIPELKWGIEKKLLNIEDFKKNTASPPNRNLDKFQKIFGFLNTLFTWWLPYWVVNLD